MFPNRKILLPVLVWTLLAACVFAAALLQQETGADMVPCLSLSNVFGWVGAVMMLYLVLVWPVSLERTMQRMARQQVRQAAYLALGALEPALLFLYGMPVLVAAASFGDKGLAEILKTGLVMASLALGTLAHFQLGFYFKGNFARPYFVAMAGVCLLFPLTNVVFGSLYGEGPAFLAHLSPFFAVVSASSGSPAMFWGWMTFVFVFCGIGAAFLAVPVLLALPPRVYQDQV